MPRCSLKKLVISIVIITTLGWTVFLFYNYVFAMRQKSILRYQIEQELSRHVCGLCVELTMHDRVHVCGLCVELTMHDRVHG